MLSIGKFGLSHRNNGGTRFELHVARTFVKRTKQLWRHPRSKLPHQIDHILTKKSDFFRFVDAAVTSPLLDSDQLAVKIKLRIAQLVSRRNRQINH